MVVRGFSLRVGEGEWVALAGANGSGKTSVALALAGLRPVRRGTIEWQGRSLGAGPPEARSGIAAVLEQPSTQILRDTVADEVAFTSRNLGRPDDEARASAARWMRRLGLDPVASRDPRHLSAGGQQRVLLAAALATGPRLLVADEAGAHLDDESRAIVLEALREEVDSGLAVVWVTQERVEIAAADRVLTLGTPAPPSTPAGPAASMETGPPLLSIRISPWGGGAGPHVATPRPLEIEIPSRGVVALRGPNGIGKTVVLSVVAGLDTLEQVRLAWSDPSPGPAAYAGQFPELQSFEERVADEISYAAVSRGMTRRVARSRAIEQLELLGFEGSSFMERITWDLSAGERRIVQVVGALIAMAPIVVLDEPSAGLDESKQTALATLIARRSETTPILLASHDETWVRMLPSFEFDLSDAATTLPSPSKKTD